MKHGIKLYDTLLGVAEGTVAVSEIISLRVNENENENNNNMTWKNKQCDSQSKYFVKNVDRFKK